MRQATRSVMSIVVIASLCSTAPARAGDVELVHDKGFWGPSLQAVGEAAQAASGVRIVQTPYSSAEQYKAFIQVSIAGGRTPNMFTWWTGQTFAELVSSGRIARLNGLWAELLASEQYSRETAEFFRVGDDYYGVPLFIARWIVIYNADLFAGLDIAEPATWAALMAAAEKLKQAGHVPFNATVQDGWRGFIWFQELLLRTNPRAYQGLHDGTVAYDSEPVRNVFRIWSDLYARGYFSDARSIEEARDFARGKAAMYLIGEWAAGVVAGAGLPVEKQGAFILPNVDPRLPPSVIIEAAPIAVSNAGRQSPDVMTALRFWTSVPGANVWAGSSGNYVGNVKARAPNAIIAKISEDIRRRKPRSYLRWWEAVPADLQGELVAEMNRFMLDPTMPTAERAMRTMQAVNAQYWAENE